MTGSIATVQFKLGPNTIRLRPLDRDPGKSWLRTAQVERAARNTSRCKAKARAYFDRLNAEAKRG